MKRQFIFGTILSAAFAVGAAAQQPPTSAQTPGQSSEASKTVTMAGCLQSAGASSTTPGAPASATAGAAGGFILANASAKTAGGSSPSSTGSAAGTPTGSSSAGAGASTGTSGSRPGSMAGTTYRLTGGDDKDLQKYVGQKIEVTGSVSARGAGSSAEPSASAPTSGAAAQALSVTSVKPTGERCGQ